LLDQGRVLVPGPRAELGHDAVIVDEESAIVTLSEVVESPAWWERVKALVGG
jgi:hypothetical protein